MGSYRAGAALPGESRGRFYEEASCSMRSPYQRDRDRIIHSTAFRRLTHKTQVFIYYEGDHYRTRLTHTLEVAQIARSIARMLSLNEDLTEAVALAHDLGHSPFGHAGERALNRVMKEYGGFDHNAQSLKHVTLLEHKYPLFDGLNLSYECLEGIVKHNGPLKGDHVPDYVKEFNSSYDLGLDSHTLLEAQVAALADDIAYSNHDIDDGLRAGLIVPNDLETVPLTKQLLDDIRGAYGQLPVGRLVYELNRRLITAMVEDMTTTSRARLEEAGITTADEVRRAGVPLIQFSSAMRLGIQELRAFLFETVYRDGWVMQVMGRAEDIVSDLFHKYQDSTAALPSEWREAVNAEADEKRRAVMICDFVAGMTDRYALLEHQRLFDATPELR